MIILKSLRMERVTFNTNGLAKAIVYQFKSYVTAVDRTKSHLIAVGFVDLFLLLK